MPSTSESCRFLGGLGFRGLGFRGLEFRGLGVWGFRVEGSVEKFEAQGSKLEV